MGDRASHHLELTASSSCWSPAGAVLFTAPAGVCRREGRSRNRRSKRLIEFGWDEPDTAFLRRHVAEMEKTPFDGCVFHVLSADPQGKRENFTWLCWGRRAFTEAELKPALDDLKATTARRFTHNFLRFNTAPGDLDWFDDHAAVLGNARLAASSPARAGARASSSTWRNTTGGLFTYPKQRDAKTKSWDEYAAQAQAAGSGGHGGVPGGLSRPDRLPHVRSQPAPDQPRGARSRWRNAATGCWRRSSTG